MITERDITAAKARELQEQSGLSQTAFWNAVGVQQSVGCRYQAGQTKIPKPVRMLIVATYVSRTGTALADIKGVKAEAKRVEGELSRCVNALVKAQTELRRATGDAV